MGSECAAHKKRGGSLGYCVCNGALLQCSFASSTGRFTALPGRVMVAGQPVASIMASVALVNIPPLGLCSSPANPAVAQATAAAGGVLTPAPCLPLTVGPWVPGAPRVLVDGFPVLTSESTLMCCWSGVITVVAPGEQTVRV